MAAEEFDLQKKYEKKKEEERRREKGIIEDKKRLLQIIKVSAIAASAKPVPPLGPALSQKGVDAKLFCLEFNKLTANAEPGLVLPALVFFRADKTFDLVIKDPTTAFHMAALRRQVAAAILDFEAVFQQILLSKTITLFQRPEFFSVSVHKVFKSLLGTLRSAKLRLRGQIRFRRRR
jgi:large subunit ribosomal protein L11